MNRSEMRRCGQHWPTREAALNSKRGLTGRYAALRCLCGGWLLSKVKDAPREKPKPARDTGPDRATRALVLTRDGYQCVACGKPVGRPGTWWSMQHRLARGQGGGNSPENLLALCGSATSPGCHRLAEDRDEHMHAAGYWLNSWESPALTGVLYVSEHGSGMLMYLGADGSLSPGPPIGMGGAA